MQPGRVLLWWYSAAYLYNVKANCSKQNYTLYVVGTCFSGVYRERLPALVGVSAFEREGISLLSAS